MGVQCHVHVLFIVCQAVYDLFSSGICLIILLLRLFYNESKVKVKVILQQAEVAQGVPGSLRPRIFLTFDTTRPYAPATFTPGEIPGTHFQGLYNESS